MTPCSFKWKKLNLSNFLIMEFFFHINCLYFIIIIITLQYCIGFAIHQHASTMGVHVFLEGDSFFSRLFPAYIAWRLLTLAIVSVLNWFPIVLLTGIPRTVRDGENLVLELRFGCVFSFLFSFHYLKRCQDSLPLVVGFLKVGCV